MTSAPAHLRRPWLTPSPSSSRPTHPSAPAGDRWVGVASVLQVALILGSALLFFASRSPADESFDAF